MSRSSSSTPPPPYRARHKGDTPTRSLLKAKASKTPAPSTVFHITGDIGINNSGTGSGLIFFNGSSQHTHFRTNTHYHRPTSTNVSAPPSVHNLNEGIQHHLILNHSEIVFIGACYNYHVEHHHHHHYYHPQSTGAQAFKHNERESSGNLEGIEFEKRVDINSIEKEVRVDIKGKLRVIKIARAPWQRDRNTS